MDLRIGGNGRCCGREKRGARKRKSTEHFGLLKLMRER